MKIKSLILICLFSIVKASAQSEAYFLSQPSLTPDGQNVVFCFDGDIWKANITDGQAERLTAMRTQKKQLNQKKKVFIATPFTDYK